MKQVKYPVSYVVWDLETTGLDPKTSRIVEIGCMIVENNQIKDRKRWVLDHKIEIPAEITRINGMTKEIIHAEGREPKAVIEEFLAILRTSNANITHNGIKFDIPFLVEEVKRCSPMTSYELLNSFLKRTSIDTASIFKAKMMGNDRMWNETFYEWAERTMSVIMKGRYNLGFCCDDLMVDRSKIVQHRALGDVELTHEIYKKMLLSDKFN